MSALRNTRERGGITILVALMLLALLTALAVGMSRTGLQEVMIAGVARQGMEVRNVADSGLEWTMTHMQPDPTGNRDISKDPGAKRLQQAVADNLATAESQGTSLTLVAWAGSPMIDVSQPGVTRSFDLQMIRMGKLKMPLTSVGQVAEVLHPDLWSVRADASLIYSGSASFRHSRELWLTTPAAGTVQ